MSFGSTAASTGSAVGSTASNASPALGGAGYGTTAADTIGSTASNVGPTISNALSQQGYVQGSSFIDTLKDYYSRFNKGYEDNAIDMYKDGKFGNNPETYGYLYSLSKYGKGGQQQQQAPMMVNRYEQPDNPYLRKRGY